MRAYTSWPSRDLYVTAIVTDASSVNTLLLQRISEPLAQLYARDRARGVELLARSRGQPGIRRLPINLVMPDRR